MSLPLNGKALAERFDHYAREQAQNPFPIYDAIRDACPLGYSRSHGGFHIATTYETAKTVFSDFRTFTSTQGTGVPSLGYQLLPIDLDPPLQTRFRKILNPSFTPDAVAQHRQQIQSLVDDFIDAFIERGTADLAAELIRPTLSSVVLPLLGVPLDDQPFVAPWVDTMIRKRADDPGAVAEKTGLLTSYLAELVSRSRADPHGESVLSVLIDAGLDGTPVSDDQIVRVMVLILFGGLDTTSAVMAEALLYLSRNRGDAERLLSGSLGWGRAIEEFVRLTSPVQGQKRVATRDTELDGVRILQGESIFSLNAAANRDPSHFSEPNRCLLDRAENPHLAFGAGAHICLGRNLARLEIEIVLKSVLDRMPDYAIPADFVPNYAVGEARGMTALPAVFTPGIRLEGTRLG